MSADTAFRSMPRRSSGEEQQALAKVGERSAPGDLFAIDREVTGRVDRIAAMPCSGARGPTLKMGSLRRKLGTHPDPRLATPTDLLVTRRATRPVRTSRMTLREPTAAPQPPSRGVVSAHSRILGERAGSPREGRAQSRLVMRSDTRTGSSSTRRCPAPDTTNGSTPSLVRHGSRSLLTGKNTSCSPTATRTWRPFQLIRVSSGSGPGAPVVRQARATSVIHSTKSSAGGCAGPDMYPSSRLALAFAVDLRGLSRP